jgi:hypothetical protein
MKDAATAAERLSVRTAQVQREIAKTSNGVGGKPNTALVRELDMLKEYEKRLAGVQRQYQTLRTRGMVNGGSYASQTAGVESSFDALFAALGKKKLTKGVLDGAFNDIAKSMHQLKIATDATDAALRRTGQTYDQMMAKARKYTSETSFEREGRLRRAAGGLVVPPSAVAGTSAVQAQTRLEQAIVKSYSAKTRLDAALKSDAGAVRITRLTALYEGYERRVAHAIALQKQLNKAEAEGGHTRGLGDRVGTAFINTSIYGAAASAICG